MIFSRSQAVQRLLITLMMVLVFAALGQAPAEAQDPSSQTPDLQQMQKKMEQLKKNCRN